MKKIVSGWGKQLAEAAGLRLRRAGMDNRFDAMRDSLLLLRHAGYRPRVVIDGGANIGTWTTLASCIFPDAEFHLVEPQQECRPHLATLDVARYEVHAVVITRPGVATVRLASAGEGINTGAHALAPTIDPPPDVRLVEYPATTLDALFGERLRPDDRLLLKLDLEGHELEALAGASALLEHTEVVVSEVTFFDVDGSGHILFEDVLRDLSARGFLLYDFAALAARPRDRRLRRGDAVFVRKGTPLVTDVSWD